MEPTEAESNMRQEISFKFDTPDNSHPLVFLKLVKEAPQIEADLPSSSTSYSRTLAIHPGKLTVSPFFAALLQRWASNGLHANGPTTVKVFELGCEDPDAASLAIQILAESLSLMRGKRSWSPSRIWGLELSGELEERLADLKSDSGSAFGEELLRKLMEGAMSLESGPFFCKFFPSKSQMDGSERLRVVVEEIGDSEWLGLNRESVQTILGTGLVLELGFGTANALLQATTQAMMVMRELPERRPA
ncbi:hypothetical protein KFL_001630130 [Klebsormidium nitens]|uniref:Uncharacterized protein n=1 Tax=Klebsormidium nitens TaxID=105231 RepID=A0A1Y1HYV2_KLENI|nr:hypothetical protein KFL_001630130 [Klebsormidium nitens]|eukprot:GAQ83815.1 hypothetical protein KFL_001630130 [Klebsormidium nitens]